jgi:hypothetical protein
VRGKLPLAGPRRPQDDWDDVLARQAQTRFRPPRLASYSIWSAAEMNSIASRMEGSGTEARPTLMVTGMV